MHLFGFELPTLAIFAGIAEEAIFIEDNYSGFGYVFKIPGKQIS